jgi:hypothetical protein
LGTAAGYLGRYQAGAYEQVWTELRALGAAVREEPVWSDARSVAAETMRRARANVALLVERLDTLGYCFDTRGRSGARPAWTPATAESRERLATCERMYGALPLSLRAWYSIVGAVDFSGTHPRLNPCPDPIEVSGQGAQAAPLVIYPCAEESIRHVVKVRMRAGVMATQRTRDAADEMDTTWVALALAPGTVACGDEESGAESAIPLPDLAADAAPAWGVWKGVPFVSYLRLSFAWGGFPGLMDAEDPPREELDYLRRGLMPL